MKVFTVKPNGITGTTEWSLEDEDFDHHQDVARSGFADMLHDTERNKKYCIALQLAIEKMHTAGKRANVLDIGTGTGLLSIMAARNGADSIIACEAFKPMAECCIQILKHNNIADKIKVIPKRSTELIVGLGGDMPEKANILVTELFDTELIGEGAIRTFIHAHQNLLEPDCIVVPDSAIVYAQVVECPTLQKWHKLDDLVDEDSEIILKTPEKIKNCVGLFAVHDIQLSQLPRESFRILSEPMPVFYFDWSGRTPLALRRTVKQQFTAAATGQAQMVFMWWDLNMDTEGKVRLSCAPWWNHPDADLSSQRPQDTIPWRDHWMQAVYYLPRQINLEQGSGASIISCHDEYSLWFYLERGQKLNNYNSPFCDCGVHSSFSRTHVSYLNDGRRSKNFLRQLREEITNKSVVIDLNGSCLMGLAAAKMGAKTVYILETSIHFTRFLNDYMACNNIDNVKIIREVNEDIVEEITNVVCDPNYPDAMLPWDNLKLAYLLYKYRERSKEVVSIIPESCQVWGMPVEFQDLHKIRTSVGTCEGIDMSVFDQFVERSRTISDCEVESMPLWEYPCRCRGLPRKLVEIDMRDLKSTYASRETHQLLESETVEEYPVNGFAMWAEWKIGGRRVSAGPRMRPAPDPPLGEEAASGPTPGPTPGRHVDWDTHSRQAVKLLSKTYNANSADKWCHRVDFDLGKGDFKVTIDMVSKE